VKNIQTEYLFATTKSCSKNFFLKKTINFFQFLSNSIFQYTALYYFFAQFNIFCNFLKPLHKLIFTPEAEL